MRQDKNQQNEFHALGLMTAIFMRGLFLAAILAASPLAMAADAYLKALEAEAEASATMTEEATAESATGPQVEFEQLLAAERPNVFKFYERLTPERKAQVLDFYLKNDKKLSVAGKKIFDLYFEQQ